MRVAIVYRLDTPGGVQSCVISLIRGLNRNGIVPDILWDVEPKSPLLQGEGIQANYRRLRFLAPSRLIDRIPYTLRYLAWITNVIDGDRLRGNYDFFYIFYNGFLLGSDVPHVRYMPGPPLLPQLQNFSRGLRGMPYRTLRWSYRIFWKRIFPAYEFHRNGNYVTISQFTAAMFKETYGVDLPVISPPIDLGGRRFTFDDLPQRDTLTFFSRIVDYKRPEVVLELAGTYRKLRFVIMGGVTPHRRPYFEVLQRHASEMNLENVIFLDNPSNQRVKDELARTRFYIFPAYNEHFGMTTAEAIASGAIPFVHDSGGQREIVCDPRLRFQDAEFHEKFAALKELSDAELNEVRKKLFDHIQEYSEEVYLMKMLAYLKP